MSLQKACKYVESNQPNEPLFGAVLNIWQKLGLPLPIADITKLIHQLPESTQNLVRIVRDDAHAGILTGLSAKAALQWLESTQGVERKAYLSPQGEDMLYMRLHSIQRPDLALIWRMLVEEPGAYTEKVSWGDYLEDCDYWLNKARKLNLPVDSKLYLYNELAKSLKDPSKLQDETNRSKLLSFLPVRREVLALLAEQSKSPITDSVERIIDQWIYLLGFWLFEKNPLVQSYVVNALRINVERSDLLNIIVDYHLNLDSLSRLLEFSKENAVSPESIRIITNEIERRKTPRPTLSSPVQGFTPGTVANESFPTYDRLVQPEPWSLPSRPVQRKKTRSFSRRGFCLGIGLLIMILFVAVVAVILVVIIITTPDLLNQIPDFLGQLSNFLSKIFP
jgi:hypothetical protein